MNLKKVIFLLVVFSIIFVSVSRPFALESNINSTNNLINEIKEHIEKSNFDNKEDPKVILENSILFYKKKFPNYLDINGLNVTNKISLRIANYNSHYKVPEFYNIMQKYQKELNSSLNNEELEKNSNYRKRNKNYDNYLKFINKHQPKKTYFGAPNTELLSGNTHQYGYEKYLNSLNVEDTSLKQSLLAAGLTTFTTYALLSSIEVISSSISISFIPVIGWPLSIALVIGALIAITAILIQNWDTMKVIMNDIKRYFIEKFDRFKSVISTYLDDVTKKGYQSTVVSEIKIGGKTITFAEVKENDFATHLEFVEMYRRTNDVILIDKVNQYGMQVAYLTPVDMNFCISHKTHLKYSSYTWYQNNARRLIVKAGSGYTSPKPEIHLKDKKHLSYSTVAFKHYHNYNVFGKRIREPEEVKNVHSFFGLPYYIPNLVGEPTLIPGSPTN